MMTSIVTRLRLRRSCQYILGGYYSVRGSSGQAFRTGRSARSDRVLPSSNCVKRVLDIWTSDVQAAAPVWGLGGVHLGAPRLCQHEQAWPERAVGAIVLWERVHCLESTGRGHGQLTVIGLEARTRTRTRTRTRSWSRPSSCDCHSDRARGCHVHGQR